MKKLWRCDKCGCDMFQIVENSPDALLECFRCKEQYHRLKTENGATHCYISSRFVSQGFWDALIGNDEEGAIERYYKNVECGEWA